MVVGILGSRWVVCMHAHGRSGGQALLVDLHVTVAEESKKKGIYRQQLGEENKIKVRVGVNMLVIDVR